MEQLTSGWWHLIFNERKRESVERYLIWFFCADALVCVDCEVKIISSSFIYHKKEPLFLSKR